MTRYTPILIGLLFLLASCGTRVTPTPAPTSTPTLLPTDTPEPTATSTPGPLTAQAIFERVSPAIAFVDTGVTTGTGVLSEQGYLVTNAHVVWPFESVRVVFPDGTEIANAPVIGFDLMGDLAVVGPLDVKLPGLPLVDGESQVIGSKAYLIGYPGEVDKFPKASISQGLISRMREWEPAGITYLQSDARIAGGQSGGALVSERGEVIGISGFSFAEAEFVLAASAADVWPRIQALIAGEDVDQLGDRMLFKVAPKERHTVVVKNQRNWPAFVVNEPTGTEFEVQLSSLDDYAFVINDIFGEVVGSSNDSEVGANSASFEIEQKAPYFITIVPTSDFAGTAVTLIGSEPIWQLRDPDDGQVIRRGHTKTGSIDIPGEFDAYQIVLQAGEEINIKVDSVMIDAVLALYLYEALDPNNAIAVDDDSGRGVFGTNPEITFQAPKSGIYEVVVVGATDNVGGYFITVDAPYVGAPTAIVPTPTVTPIASDAGDMKQYRFEGRPHFSIQYPADWLDEATTDEIRNACELVAACFALPGDAVVLVIVIEDLQENGLGGISQEEYVNGIIDMLQAQAPEFELIERQPMTTASGQQVEEIEYQVGQREQLRIRRLIHVRNDVGFNATYVFAPRPEDVELEEDQKVFWDEIDRIIEYSFDSFGVD